MSLPDPRVKTVHKVTPPFELNHFPKGFLSKLGAELVYLMATKTSYSLEGNEWEEIFAHCVGAEWKPSNVGLDDVQLSNTCCWGAKTVKASGDLRTQKRVRLISGRNSPVYSYQKQDYLSMDPSELGSLVLNIWNERVSSVRRQFKFVRTVVLVKGKNFDEFSVFETDTLRYDPSLYTWRWNSRDNLEGFDAHGQHRFTWQPHGSQFTIVEDIPSDALYFAVRRPQRLDKAAVLKGVGFQEDWIQKWNVCS